MFGEPEGAIGSSRDAARLAGSRRHRVLGEDAGRGQLRDLVAILFGKPKFKVRPGDNHIRAAVGGWRYVLVGDVPGSGHARDLVISPLSDPERAVRRQCQVPGESGTGYSVIAPAVVMLRILKPVFSVNHSVSFCQTPIFQGSLWGVGTGYSLIAPLVVMRPMRLPALLGKPECAIQSGLDPNGLAVGMGKGVLSDASVVRNTTDRVPHPLRKPERPVWPGGDAERQAAGGRNVVFGEGLGKRWCSQA